MTIQTLRKCLIVTILRKKECAPVVSLAFNSSLNNMLKEIREHIRSKKILGIMPSVIIMSKQQKKELEKEIAQGIPVDSVGNYLVEWIYGLHIIESEDEIIHLS